MFLLRLFRLFGFLDAILFELRRGSFVEISRYTIFFSVLSLRIIISIVIVLIRRAFRFLWLFLGFFLELHGDQLLICPRSHKFRCRIHCFRRGQLIAKSLRRRHDTRQQRRRHLLIQRNFRCFQIIDQLNQHLAHTARSSIVPIRHAKRTLDHPRCHRCDRRIMENPPMRRKRCVQMITIFHIERQH